MPIFARVAGAAVAGYGAGMVEDTVGSNEFKEVCTLSSRDGPALRAVWWVWRSDMRMQAARGAPIQPTGAAHDYMAVYIVAQSIGGIAAMHFMVLSRPLPTSLPQLRKKWTRRASRRPPAEPWGGRGWPRGWRQPSAASFRACCSCPACQRRPDLRPRVFIRSP